MDQRIRAIFIGTVQGVGFRFSVVRIAQSLSVCGTVRNLSNGSVEIIAEASKETLTRFIEQIKDRFAGYIRSEQISWDSASGEFTDFTITF